RAGRLLRGGPPPSRTITRTRRRRAHGRGHGRDAADHSRFGRTFAASAPRRRLRRTHHGSTFRHVRLHSLVQHHGGVSAHAASCMRVRQTSHAGHPRGNRRLALRRINHRDAGAHSSRRRRSGAEPGTAERQRREHSRCVAHALQRRAAFVGRRLLSRLGSPSGAAGVALRGAVQLLPRGHRRRRRTSRELRQQGGASDPRGRCVRRRGDRTRPAQFLPPRNQLRRGDRGRGARHDRTYRRRIPRAIVHHDPQRAEVSAALVELLDLVTRWLHVIAGIMWIGNSLLFNWLDRNLRRSSSAAHAALGEIWLLHSGGFYFVEKTLLAGQPVPQPLHWFKWQAYTTWLSGAALLVIVYYAGGRALIADPTVAPLSHAAAVLVGIGAIAAGLALYEAMQRWVAPIHAPIATA